MAVQAMVASPKFVFRFEHAPADARPGGNFRLSDLDLASRLSYFLWSSARTRSCSTWPRRAG